MAWIGIDARGIWESDEGRYTAVPVEMLRSGDLLTPRLNLDEPHLTKPPLTYWTVAASFAAFGIGETQARLPNLLAFVLTVLVVHALGRRFAPRRPWLPALIFATMPVTVLGANVVTTDTWLSLFEALAVLCFLAMQSGSDTDLSRGYFSGDGKIAPNNSVSDPDFLMWVAFGMGFLTKGPPTLLPLLPMAIWVVNRHGWPALRALFPWRGLLAFSIIGLGWFAWLTARDPALAGYFIGDEVIARFASDLHDRNPEWHAPITVYGPVLLAAVLPWGLAQVKALQPARLRAAWAARGADDLGRFATWWFIAPLVVLCLSRSRQPAYVLPLCVPLALMLGRALEAEFDLARWRWRALTAVALALPIALKLWLADWPYYKDTRGLAAHVATTFDARAGDRIVFWGRWPQWGLRVYTPARVGWRDADQPICDALAPAGGRTLVIVLNKRHPDLAAGLAACGHASPRRLAPFRDMGLYAVD